MIVEFPVTVPVTVLFMLPLVMVTATPVLKFDPLITTGRTAVLIPEDGLIVVIDGSVLGFLTVKQFSFVADEPSGLVTVRLYKPFDTLVRLNVPVNFVVVNEETVPGMIVLLFTRVVWRPLIKFVPDIAIAIGPEEKPVDGLTVEIVGIW